MLPISLLIWIVLELALYLAMGRFLVGADWPAAITGAIITLLIVRANLNVITWIFAAVYRSPGKKIGFWRKLSIIVDEYFAYLLTFLLVIPFERLWMPADRLRDERRVILLVHGYGCSRGVWWLLRRRLEAAGCTVASISLAPPFISMGKMVPQLRERIDAVCAATGARKLTLVGHSMGGLICRSYLARHGHDKVTALITLATPHAGSELSRFGIGQNAREMEPGSLWLRDMAGDSPAIPTIAFHNNCDNYVMPQDNQKLPGAYNVDLPPIGHIAMLYDRRVANLVIDACSDQGFH
jgi:triacylglycerol lipase